MLPFQLLVALTFCQVSLALHFYLNTGESKCFFEELPVDTLMVGRIDAFEKNLATGVYEKAANLRVEITVDVC